MQVLGVIGRANGYAMPRGGGGETRGRRRANAPVTDGLLAALGCVAALVGAKPRERAQTPQDWDKVVAAAKQEGKVSVYSGYLSSTNEAIAKAFEAKYGIKVEILQARGNELRERLRIEQATGRPDRRRLAFSRVRAAQQSAE